MADPPFSTPPDAHVTGWVLRVDGPLVDVEFDPAALPRVGAALRVTPGAQPPGAITWGLWAEVIAHEDRRIARAVALGDTQGLARGQPVFATGAPLEVPVGDAVCGRVIDPLGNPLDDEPPVAADAPRRPLRAASPAAAAAAASAVAARPAPQLVVTGIRAIDLLAPVVRGGAIGVLGGAGTGKSLLLRELVLRARLGERAVLAAAGMGAAEALEFVLEWRRAHADGAGTRRMSRAAIVHAGPSDAAGMRAAAALAGLTLAEAFCDAGHDTTLLVDDAWRAAQAEAEVALATRRAPRVAGGVADALAARARGRRRGAGGGVLTTLEAVHLPADDPTDPSVVELLDGLDVRLVLARTPYPGAVFPGLDPLRCASALASRADLGPRHARLAAEARGVLQRAAELDDAARLWGVDGLATEAQDDYRRGRRLARFLVQPLGCAERFTGRPGAFSPLEDTLADVAAILAGEGDELPEACFELARDLAEVRARAR